MRLSYGSRLGTFGIRLLQTILLQQRYLHSNREQPSNRAEPTHAGGV